MSQEIEQLIKLHDEAKKALVIQQHREELREKITKKIKAANEVNEYTANPWTAAYTRALEEVLELLDPPKASADPARVNAAVQMGFLNERSGYNPYME